ncbi:MAG: MarR family transcriptional regulator [Ktedonobacteraceae bacterium]
MTTMRKETASVTPRQLEVLTFLSDRDHWLVGEIATALKVSSAAATKAIARLERKGLVVRAIDMMDRRCVNVSLTRSGSETARQLSQNGK